MPALLKPAVETKILVVDDTPDNLRLLARILEAQNYTVLKALNGRMAIQAANREPIDLILLDINMPELNGYDVCRQLRASEKTANIPVVFISALNQVNDKVQAFEIGGQDYITKPFYDLEVVVRIKNQLLIQQQRQLLEQEIQKRQQAEAEVRQLNTHLERQVQSRTLELHQALNCELVLNQISEQVRDSLDQNQIIQTVVETLAQALEVQCCDAALYSPDHTTSVVRYEWKQAELETAQGKTLYTADFSEIYHQLKNRVGFAFCQIQPTRIRYHSAILACPIFDHQVEESGILGALWLFRDIHSSFGATEIRLVQQVANQCAIALRQARLYEAAQAQVCELERLNQLKDDFLSTISHELRTPLANMKMVIKLLDTVIKQGQNLSEEMTQSSASSSKTTEYLTILQDECDRELDLVEDLLNLQHVEAGTYSSQPTLINVKEWLLHIIEPFESRTQNQQQTLKINIPSNIPTLKLDAFSLNRIVTELLSNACKYTPSNGTITISAHLVTEPSAIDATVAYLQLTVSNTGTEIPSEELPHIFDKFYRIPNNDPWRYGGTGLGLALIQKLIEQMGGLITVKSSNNLTCFTVRFLTSSPPKQSL